MIFAKYSIEKCYLLHQLAQTHLDQGRHSECAFNARRAIKGMGIFMVFIYSFI